MQTMNIQHMRDYEFKNFVAVYDSIHNGKNEDKDSKFNALWDNMLKLFVVNCFSYGYSKEDVLRILPFSDKYLDDIIDQIEDDELLELAETRINAYGGWEETKKHLLSESEFMAKLGITEEDFEDVEDVELI